MKKIKYFLLLCLVAIISTGCVKYNATMEIKKDKSMEFSIIYAMDKSMMSMGGESGGLKEEEFEEVKKAGYTVEKYSDDKYEGFKMTKKFNNIDEVSTDKDVVFSLTGMMEKTDDTSMFKVVKDGDKNTYYAKFKFDSNESSISTDEVDEDATEDEEDLPDEALTTTGEDITTIGEDTTTTVTSDSSSNDLDLSSLTSSMDLKFVVILPSSAISSNATTKEDNDKKLTWKLNYSGTQTIEFAFAIDPNAKDDNNMLLYIGIGAGVLILLLLIFLLTRKKGPKEFVPVNENQVEIKNDVKDEVSSEPALKEKAEVMDETPKSE